jgi:peptidyl-prolyl cis-trans isomerase D
MLRFLRAGSKRTKTIWWVIAIITIVGFLGGFVFLFGAGLDVTQNARAAGAVAMVNGERITSAEFQNALFMQRENYRRQFGTDPAERDQRMLEVQTWRQIVTERLVAQQARRAGLRASDREVVLGLQTNPPQALLASPDFQTDGQFDPQKYAQALANPGNDWSAFEALVREQLPTRKMEERLLASLKVSDGELRRAFRDRFESIDATVVALVPPPDTTRVPAPSEADLQRIYQTYRGRFASGPRVQLEVLRVPKRYGEEETRAARELAASIVDRVRKGEAFEALAATYSEGPGAEQGGLIQRPLSLQELGPELGPRLLTAAPGTVLDPIEEAGRFAIFKLVEKLPPQGPNAMPQMRVAQIQIKARPNDAALRQQYEEVKRVRDQAVRGGLGAAATAKGLATFRTSYYDFNNNPNELAMAPELAEWGLGARAGEVSPVVQGFDEFVVAQVAEKHASGVAAREEVAEPLRQIAELETRVNALQARADAVAKAVAGGASLEAAARAQGLEAARLGGMTRANPDPRIAASPELLGALLASKPGQVVGPVRSINGWYFGRLEGVVAPPDTLYESSKRQLVSEILQRRQQSFFMGLVGGMRERAKVQDLRLGGGY